MAATFRAGERGFTYLAAIFMLTILAVASAQAMEIFKTNAQRQREAQLLYVGEQFRQAIRMYYQLSPGSSAQCPTALTDLLLDKRATQTRRLLRRIYLDPMTNSTNWGVVLASDGRCITGVYSTSTAAPIKVGGFPAIEAAFSNAKQYQQWQFVYQPAS